MANATTRMTLFHLLDDLRAKCESGKFSIDDCNQLKACVRSSVPKKHGVYLIYGVLGSSNDLLYVGKAGTICQDGTLKKQTLRGRLINRQRKMARVDFFRKGMQDGHFEQLHFEWFVTLENGKVRTPPFLVESQLLAAFFDEYGCLPQWNSTA